MNKEAVQIISEQPLFLVHKVVLLQFIDRLQTIGQLPLTFTMSLKSIAKCH